ncbi:lipase [Marmoricola endophyticus]|uniref:Lipase n=1 Tax=Marmoricola endophyticus TaxID=2040280 RepID=A0A917F8K9_9ACTN|nr:lipase family protein [Marmoricola endophyticus]GGF55657.1 lipase [Marmoricola endophyticus]
MRSWGTRIAGLTAALASVALLGAGLPATATAAPTASASAVRAASPLDDPFYDYTGTTPLSRLAPGTPLKTRTVPYSVQGIPTPLPALQVLYRTRDAQGRAVANVTTVVKPLVPAPGAKVVSYQSFYDSLNPEDEPSSAIAGGVGLGKAIANAETLFIAPFLLAGYTVNIPDTEGQTADFAVGPEYGYTTLDSLRAIAKVPASGTGATSKVGLIGYSGGAIGSGWASSLAPSYAPDVAKRIVGTAMGGVLVKPSTNLHYVEGTPIWSGVLPMALIGIARAYGADLTPYASERGKQILAELDKASIADALAHYPGLRWKDIAKPEYPTPESVPVYVRLANKLIMGSGGATPSSPMFIGQGTRGELEGTPTSATSGEGDGVMVAGDVRSLARQWCGAGTKISYREYPASHTTSVPLFAPEAYAWLLARFGSTPAPSNCSSIEPGNSLAPISVQR